MTAPFHRIYRALIHSCHGLRATWISEPAFRLDVWIVAVAVGIALLVPVTPGERALLILAAFLILGAELVNTAIESTINRIGPEIHPLSKKAKDIGSAVVFVSFFQALVVWVIVLWPRVSAWI
jgi:diacylglycerol kinase (ATP)